MDETREIVETLAKVAKAGISMQMNPYQINKLSAYVTGLANLADAAEQRAAEAEALLRTVEDKLAPMMKFLSDNKLEYSVYWRDASPDDGAYVKCKVAEWQNLEETFQAAAKWLEEHGG